MNYARVEAELAVLRNQVLCDFRKYGEDPKGVDELTEEDLVLLALERELHVTDDVFLTYGP